MKFEELFEDAQFLGKGASGEVFRTISKTDLDELKPGQEVAVKLVDANTDTAKKLLRRRTRLIQISDPSIAKVFSIGELEDGRVYVASELLLGGTLRKRIEDFRSPKKVAKLFKPIVGAIVGLHSESQVHRDIKPENILFPSEESDDAKLVDLDLVRSLPVGESETRFAGTQAYLAPEYFKENTDIGPKVDVYAIGVMLYEVLAGRLPTGQRDDWRPSRHNRAVRGWMDQVVLGCLQLSLIHI